MTRKTTGRLCQGTTHIRAYDHYGLVVGFIKISRRGRSIKLEYSGAFEIEREPRRPGREDDRDEERRTRSPRKRKSSLQNPPQSLP